MRLYANTWGYTCLSYVCCVWGAVIWDHFPMHNTRGDCRDSSAREIIGSPTSPLWCHQLSSSYHGSLEREITPWEGLELSINNTVYPKKYAHGFCFVVVIHWLIYPYPSGLLHWHCGNLTIAPVPAKQPWWIWINTSCEFIMNDCITTTKQSTTKPCAYFLGCTVHVKPRDSLWQFQIVTEWCIILITWWGD